MKVTRHFYDWFKVLGVFFVLAALFAPCVSCSDAKFSSPTAKDDSSGDDDDDTEPTPNPTVTATPEPGNMVGDLALDFTLNDQNEQPVTLSNYTGSVILLNLTTMW